MQFADLRLQEPLLRALATEGYSTATPIQAQAIPHVLKGSDVLGVAQTGTGKTAAFALPILQRLMSSQAPKTPRPRCLVLCPTRELATQIADGFRAYGKNVPLRHGVIFGGVNQRPQEDLLRRGVDVLIATPGRLLDLLEQRFVDLRAIEVLVLDEADRMLDMGFIRDIRKIVQHIPPKRQTLLFSATMPAEIRELADNMLRDPVTVQVTPVSSTVEAVEQSVYFVQKSNKPQLLAHLVGALPMTRAIVFTRTKHGADRVVRHLHARGIRSEAIHGNKSQNARQRALDNFKANKIPVLVATDIASRGIDIDNVTHVVNYDLTHEPETYVHRIGRTARAGASGHAVSFCDREEVPNLRAIEKLVKRKIDVCEDQPAYSAAPAHGSTGGAFGSGGEGASSRGDNGGNGRDRDNDRRPQHAQQRPSRDQVGSRTQQQRQRHPSHAATSASPTSGSSHGGSSSSSSSHGGHAKRPHPTAGARSQHASKHSPGRGVRPEAAAGGARTANPNRHVGRPSKRPARRRAF